MKKPANWDSVEAITGNYKKLPAGGYVCNITNAECVLSKTGKEMLKVAVDIATGEYKDFFLEQYLSDKSRTNEPKWRCYYYQLTEGEALGRFKGMIQNIEASNPGYKWDWNEKSLVNKVFGGVFREEEYINRKGGISTSTKLIAIRPVEGIEEIEPPAKKQINNAPDNAGSFGEEIPF